MPPTNDSIVPREYHVSIKTGNDANQGSAAEPFRTIGRAAELAQPGDSIIVHAGTYRERITPPRGGEGEHARITYQAAAGERVEIKGSEVIEGWKHLFLNVWEAEVPNAIFGAFNPFATEIRGDWFNPLNAKHHTGAVYVDGVEFVEFDNIYEYGSPLTRDVWRAEVSEEVTRITICTSGIDPNAVLTEISVRPTLFYPDHPGVNFLTVRGFIMRHAATQWAPPTAEQIGLIGTHWSKGWIIERNEISHSRCTGVTLGKYGDAYDNKSEDTAEGYVETVQRAIENGWNRGTVGSHLVRENYIHHCEQAGIVGSLGAAFSEIRGNRIEEIHRQRRFAGAEQSAIKFHGAVDTIIAENWITRSYRGIWLDWLTQGTRVTRNVCFENEIEDLFVEVNHGPFLVDHNIFLSKLNLLERSQGGAYLHNLFGGALWYSFNRPEMRVTPSLKPHSTELHGMHSNPGGDVRFINNLVLDWEGLEEFRKGKLPVQLSGNGPLPEPVSIQAEGIGLQIDWVQPVKPEPSVGNLTTALLGRAVHSGAPFEAPDGRVIPFDTDFEDASRSVGTPGPGPFEATEARPSRHIKPRC